MTRYLISFGGHAMDHIPEEDMPAVGKAAHAVVQEAMNAGVYLLAGGLYDQAARTVAVDGTITDSPDPDGGGMTIVDVGSRGEALQWAAKIAAACRCAQDVRELMPDPELAKMLRHAERQRRGSDDA